MAKNVLKSLNLQALHQEKAPLSTHYGAITGLAELGQEVWLEVKLVFFLSKVQQFIHQRAHCDVVTLQVIKVLILSRLKTESLLIKQGQEGLDPIEKNAAENLKNLLLVII